MHKAGDFYEAYLDHGCTIIPEKDVLSNDIKGNGCLATVRRRWHDLFLLSCSDERSKRLFLSLHAMRSERARQYRYYRKSIHPFSKFRNLWDFLVLKCVLFNTFMFHHNSSIFGQFQLPVYYICVVCEIIIFVDLFINTKTGYVDRSKRKVIMNYRKILLHYSSTKLFMHAASAIPLHSLMFVKYGNNIVCTLCKSNKFICTLKFISVFSLIRSYDASLHWIGERRTVRALFFFKFLRISVLGFLTMLYALNVSNTLCLLDILQGRNDWSSLYHWLIYTKFVDEFGRQDSDFFVVIEIFRVLKSLFIFGQGIHAVESYIDRMSALLSFFVGIYFYMWATLELYSCLSRVKYPGNQITATLERTTNMLRCRQLPDIIITKVVQYYKFNLTKLTVIEKNNALYLSLPTCIKRDVKLHCYSRHITRIPYFSEWPSTITDDLTMLLKEEVYLHHDIVCNVPLRQPDIAVPQSLGQYPVVLPTPFIPSVSLGPRVWSPGDGLTILHAGVMAVYTSQNEEAGHLIDGDYFGELSLVTDKEIGSNYVIAVTHCKVLILDKAEFRKYMRSCPKLFFEMKQRLKDQYNKASMANIPLQPGSNTKNNCNFFQP